MMSSRQTVLFDLDGTLADTGPDLAFALNRLLGEQKRPELPYETIRPKVSQGGNALIQLGFGCSPDQPQFEPLRQRFLDIYEHNLCRHTQLFDGIHDVLNALDQRHIRWGIVTNKPGWLTTPLIKLLDLDTRIASLISGDTLPQRKPHPEPMLVACQQAGGQAEHCLTLGDHQRDIESANRAGMRSLAACWGYLSRHDKPETWGATALIQHPAELLDWL